MKRGNILIRVVLTMIIFLTVTGSVYAESKFNMTYLYFGSSSTYMKYINQTGESLNVVSPSYIDINSNGDLDTSNIDSNFIEYVHNKGIKVVPFVSNHWDRNAGNLALDNREERSSEIANIVDTYNLDGINIDIEGLNEESREAFTDFIRLLREKIPSHKEVSVAVAANPYNWSTGWQGMYDYTALATYSNYLMIMTYDESWEGSDPGPVASMDFIEKSIQYALSNQVPSEKIVLGIPFYGRIWNTNDINSSKASSEKILGKGVPLNNLDSILSYYNATITYDKETNSMKATFKVNTYDSKKKLYSWGVPLTAGNYEVWYEDDYSIKEKIRLVKKYNLKGTGSWALGQENQSIWNNYVAWLNGDYFIDTNNHWAEEDILTVYDKNWMLGMSSTLFGPNNNLTRAQAAVTLVRALDLEPATNLSYFTDVPNTHWAKTEIETAYKYNLINGIGNNQFSPDVLLTREQMAQMLCNLLEVELTVGNLTSGYTDISESDWSYGAIVLMSHNSIFEGFNDNTFRPREGVTRAQMASLLNRISIYLD